MVKTNLTGGIPGEGGRINMRMIRQKRTRMWRCREGGGGGGFYRKSMRLTAHPTVVPDSNRLVLPIYQEAYMGITS